MRTLILILALLPIFATAQTLERNKIVAKETLVFAGGNPDTLKIAICQNSKGEFSWMYLSELQDSMNTGVYDTLVANYISIHRIRLRDSSLAANGNILSLGQDSTVTGCGTCEQITNLITSDSVTRLSYSQADSLANNGLVRPLRWYNIYDDSVYVMGLTDSTYTIDGYYADSVINEVDKIKFDFANGHVFERHDKRGNTVGASYTALANSLVSVDPISVFKWGNDLVFNNTVKDGVFNCTATDDTTLIFATVVTGYADVELSGGGTFAENTFGLEGIGIFTGNENLIGNNTLNGGEFNIPNNTGTFTQNNFEGGTFTASNNSGELSGNIMYGVNSSITANNNQGRVFGNNGYGTIQANNLGVLAKVAGNILVDGGTIIANGVVRNEAGCDANVVRGNSILRANGLNGKVFNNTVDGYAIVVADSSKGWIYSSLFTGGDSTDISGDYDTSVYYVVTRDSNYRIDGCVFQTFDSLVLNPSENYFFQRFGNLSVNGSLSIYDGTEGTGKVLTSDANGNATWEQPNCDTGWESIQDTTNNWVLLAGDTQTILIKRDLIINSQLPCGIDSLYNTSDSTIMGLNGDAYTISLDWRVTQNSVNATEFQWWIDIGGSIGRIYPVTYQITKGNGNSQNYNKTTAVYTLNTWEANGGKLQFTTDQNITISDVRIIIYRIHKAR